MTTARTDAGTEADTTLDQLAAEIGQALAAGRLQHAVLSKYRGAEPDLRRIDLRPVLLKGLPHLQAVWHHATRDITRNHAMADVPGVLRPLLGVAGFRAAHVRLTDVEIELSVTQRGAAHLRRRAVAATDGPAPDEAPGAVAEAAPAAALPAAHNRQRHYRVPLDRPFLGALGITDAHGRLVPAMARKWRQINKFVEICDHAIAASPLAGAAQLRIADFGCGKGYLTFALHDWLRHARGIAAEVTGVELRRELVDQANATAARLGAMGLRFVQGDLASHDPGLLDVTIALHACDTATDHALALGMRAGSAVLLAAPCCHKQLRPQLLAPHPLRPVLRHGIHLGQEAEMVTDSMRALLLERQGYDAQVFEFVALEHTAKNKMIQAVRRTHARDTAALQAELDHLKGWYGVREQALELLLDPAMSHRAAG
ncbi:MAG: class I SAM-dependent methyltransferase [Aquabacterium sp.]